MVWWGTSKTSAAPARGRWRRSGLLTKFLLILTPVFFIRAVPGIGYVVHVGLRVDQDVRHGSSPNSLRRAGVVILSSIAA